MLTALLEPLAKWGLKVHRCTLIATVALLSHFCITFPVEQSPPGELNVLSAEVAQVYTSAGLKCRGGFMLEVVRSAVATSVPTIETTGRDSTLVNEQPLGTPIGATWRDTTRTSFQHGGPILAWALVWAAGACLPVVFAGAPTIEAFIRMQSAFCAYRVPTGWVVLVFAAVDIVVQTLAQSAITLIALQGVAPHDKAHIAGSTQRRDAAWSQIIMRWRTLLFHGLLYAMVLAAGAVMLTYTLSALRLSPAGLLEGISPQRLDGILWRELAAQSANTLLPNPGSLMCNVAGAARLGLINQRLNAGVGSAPYAYSYSAGTVSNPVDAGIVLPMTLLAVTLLLLAETLLRFRFAAVIDQTGDHADRKPALIDSIRLGWRYFGTITAHFWLMKFGVATLQIACISLPVLFAERVVAPRIAGLVGLGRLYPASILLTSMLVVLANTICSAWSTVYDARLYASIRRSSMIYEPK
jgi:hypothetical protein